MQDMPSVIAALQLPPFNDGRRRSIAWYEDFLLSNARIFAAGGIKAIKVQDETRETGAAAVQTVARMSALGLRLPQGISRTCSSASSCRRMMRVAPLAIADASGAHFVRLKIFVGAAVNAEGLRNALNVAAIRYRTAIARPDIKIYADAHDRTCTPLAPVPDETAALWAQSTGADGVIITGSSFEDTLSRIAAARTAGVKRPILIGGGVTADNVASSASCRRCRHRQHIAAARRRGA